MKKCINYLIVMLSLCFLLTTSCNNDDVEPTVDYTMTQNPNDTIDGTPEVSVPDVVNQAPEAFELLTVADSATNIDLLPEFTWKAAIDPEGDTVTYGLYLGTSEPLALYDDNLSSKRYQVQDRLSLSDSYSWKVVATDSYGNPTESGTHNFVTRGLNFANDPITAEANFSARTNHTTTVYDNKLWVIGGLSDGFKKNDVWVSADGINWAEVNPAADFSTRSQHTTVVYDDKLWVMGGANGSTTFDVWHSTDGINWTEATSAAGLSVRTGHTTVVFQNKIWVIGGLEQTAIDPKNDIWVSSDGVVWTEITTSTKLQERFDHTTTVHDNKLWVISGYGNKILNDVWVSNDGISWSKATSAASFSARHDHSTALYDNKLWVVGGQDQSNVYNDVWYSSNGKTWALATVAAPFSIRYGHSSFAYDDKLWVIAGSATNLIYTNDVWAMN